MIPAGTVLKIVADNCSVRAVGLELPAERCDYTVYVSDPGTTPSPGLAIVFPDALPDDIDTFTAHTPAQMHTYATTGAFP